MTLTSAFIAAGLLAACEPPATGPVQTEILPVEPTGTISGLVRDVLSGVPLEGVEVVVLQTGASVTTDATGAFTVDAPASAGVALTFSREGYFDAFDTVNVVNAAGNLAQENGVGFSGPIGMIAASADPAPVPVRVLDNEGGVISEASIRATLGVRFFDDGASRGEIVASVVDGEELGEYVLEGLPDLLALAALDGTIGLTLSIAPPPGVDLAPTVRTVTLATFLSTTPLEVSLAARVEAALRLVDTNVPEFFDEPQQVPATLPVGTPVTLTFSRDIDPAGVSVDALNEAGNPLTTSPGLDSREVLTISVDAPAGSEVLLTVRAEAAADDDVFTKTVFFFTEPAGGSPQILPGPYTLGAVPSCPTLPQPEGILVRFDAPVGARNLAGEPVTGGALERARVVLSGFLNGEAGRFDLNSNDPVFATVEEAVDGRESGFTTQLRIPWPGVPTENRVGENEVTYTMSLVFNEGNGTPVIDTAGNTLGNIGGELTLTIGGCL